jgi:sugar phosphate isomerase/epimerase
MAAMAYRRAFSTLGCPDLTLEQAFALARTHGCDGVELRILSGRLDLPAYLGHTYGTPEALAARLRGEAVTIVSLDTSLRLVENNPPDRAAFLDFVPWAEALGVPHLRVFDGGRVADAEEMAQAAATLRWWRELRAARGWKTDMAVETHDSLFTAEKIARFLEVCPGTKILWDAHHTWRQGGEDPVATWRRIGAHVPHIHVKDSVSRPAGKQPYTYIPPGEGEFPAGPLFGILRREFSGVVSLEWERHWHPTLAPLEVALQAAKKNGW